MSDYREVMIIIALSLPLGFIFGLWWDSWCAFQTKKPAPTIPEESTMTITETDGASCAP